MNYFLVSVIFYHNGDIMKEISNPYTNFDKCKFDAIKILSQADEGGIKSIIITIIDNLGGIQKTDYINIDDINSDNNVDEEATEESIE